MMSESTPQMQKWASTFGRDYTDRNEFSIEEMEAFYRRNYGYTRTELNQAFVGSLDRSLRVLEVGANIGNQLICLQKMGFESLYGIELQPYAVEKAKSRSQNINIIQGSAFDIPFKDGFASLVFTSGVLIHIAPSDIPKVLDEIYRCSNRYIWGFEYFAERYTDVNYRGHDRLLWKTNFCQLYLERFPHLRLLKAEKYKYADNENVDAMFLLEKSVNAL